MASTEEIIIEQIMQLLWNAPGGLEVNEIIQTLGGSKIVSPRGIRNLLSEMERDKRVVKLKRWSKKRGSPPFAYFHPDRVPKQMSFWDEFVNELGASSQQFRTKPQIEKEDIDEKEKVQLDKARSVLEEIAKSHIDSDDFAKAIVENAEEIATQNPLELVIQMADWMVENIKKRAKIARDLKSDVDRQQKIEKIMELDLRLSHIRKYFYSLWRLYPYIEDVKEEQILLLPENARQLIKSELDLDQQISFNADKARKMIEKRIIGNKIADFMNVPEKMQKSAVGTDASVADLYMDHAQGSFIPPDPVIVTASAAVLKTLDECIYQDFDIYPDKLSAYSDLMAAFEGLVISPALKDAGGEIDLKHTRMAAMDLRQYNEDLSVALWQAKWRPFGGSPMEDIPKPRLIIRDGRIFPLVHRINDYEANNLYGKIVRREIEIFEKVFHNTVMDINDIVYAAAVKNPEMSWLAPLVFWFLHKKGVQKGNGDLVVDENEVYKLPFADTAVSHLLFLGLAKIELAKRQGNFLQQEFFVTCRVIRRFSDIAVPKGARVLESDPNDPIFERRRLVDENTSGDWYRYIDQRIKRKKDDDESYEGTIDESDYDPFLSLCMRVGTSMCYAAPAIAYTALCNDSEGAHFLLPRLEVAVDMERLAKKADESLMRLLSWLANKGMEPDHGHTQSAFNTGNREGQLPVLVPDVIYQAHETVTFARDVLGQEVQDEIRKLILELRRRAGKVRIP